MKKVVVVLFIVGLLGAYPAYVHKDFLLNRFENVVSDRADEVLDANTPDDKIIEVFENETHGKITLVAGTEEFHGFRHILARHTKKYFINFERKNNTSHFDESIEVTGTDIIYALEHFYANCVDVKKYSNKNGNLSYLGFVNIKGERVKCMLIVKERTNEITTFYPYNERKPDYNYD